MLSISIPTPCHEDWDNMRPDELGRHCFSCAKTVVDFTAMTDEQVKRFFLDKKDEKICGRFHGNQLHRIRIELPQNIFELTMPWWKRFLVASLIVFSTTLFSCDVMLPQQTIGKAVIPVALTVRDTTVVPLLGDTMIVDKPVAAPPVINHIDTITDHLMGDMVMIPDTVIIPGVPERILTGKPAVVQDTVKPDCTMRGKVVVRP